MSDIARHVRRFQLNSTQLNSTQLDSTQEARNALDAVAGNTWLTLGDGQRRVSVPATYHGQGHT